MSGQTPAPWRLNRVEFKDGLSAYEIWCDNPCLYIAGLYDDHNGYVARLDAEHIVRLVNTHNKVLSALKSAYKAIASLAPDALGGHEATTDNPEEFSYYFRDELLAQINSALAGGVQ